MKTIVGVLLIVCGLLVGPYVLTILYTSYGHVDTVGNELIRLVSILVHISLCGVGIYYVLLV
jgi:hypothetical protein